MSLKQKFVTAITLALAILTFAVFVSAQDKTTTAPADQSARPDKIDRHRGPRGEGRGGMRGPRDHRGPGMMFRGLHQVGLTDAQKQQVHTILENNRPQMEKLREQMRALRGAKFDGTLTAEQETQLKTLHDQIKQNAGAAHQQVLGVLTEEQKAKLEQFKQEMKQRMEERRQRGPRPGRGEGPPPPADKPTDN